MRTVAYGAARSQVADLYLPRTAPAPVVCLIHGGFWRMPYGRDYLAPLALDLAARGFAVWSIGYRRVGEEGGGWPGTFQDVGAAIDHLVRLEAQGAGLDLARVVTAGHSAGGHLALWSAQQAPALGNGYAPRHVRLAGAVGLAPVADLRRAFDLDCGKGAVRNFLGGSPTEQPERYRTSSPREMLPLGAPQLLIHGTHDADVPVDISRRYAAAAQTAGDAVRFSELPAAGHMDLVDPATEAHALLCDWLCERWLTA